MATAFDGLPYHEKETVCERALKLLLEAHQLNAFPVYVIPVGSKVSYSAEGDETLLDRIYEVLTLYPDTVVTVTLESPVE